MRTTRIRRGRDGGAAAVEFALISIPLMLLVLGIIQFGFIFYTQIMLTQGAREGVRALSLNLQSQTAGTCDASCVSNAQSKVVDFPGAVEGNFSFQSGTCPSPTDANDAATIEVRYEVPTAWSFLFSSTLEAKASMPCGG